MSLSARLFEVGTPTPVERTARRRASHANQQTFGLLDDLDVRFSEYCHACSGDHNSEDCPHGTALTFEATR